MHTYFSFLNRFHIDLAAEVVAAVNFKGSSALLLCVMREQVYIPALNLLSNLLFRPCLHAQSCIYIFYITCKTREQVEQVLYYIIAQENEKSFNMICIQQNLWG